MSEDTIKAKLLSGTYRHRDGGVYHPGEVIEVRERIYEEFSHSFDSVGNTQTTHGAQSSGGAGSPSDPRAFVDRTPMQKVIADIETGDYDSHLDAIEAAEKERSNPRTGVLDAMEDRRE